MLMGFAVTTTLAGGFVVFIRLLFDPRRAFLVWHMREKFDDGRGVPYGVAIALGALTIHWGDHFGVLPPALLFQLPS